MIDPIELVLQQDLLEMHLVNSKTKNILFMFTII